ncbi:hypothetical protein [Mesorhizobium sp. B2-4-17]|nr:hypothetical protein [Mesorhizobium sp. B2-4-17]
MIIGIGALGAAVGGMIIIMLISMIVVVADQALIALCRFPRRLLRYKASQ